MIAWYQKGASQTGASSSAAIICLLDGAEASWDSLFPMCFVTFHLYQYISCISFFFFRTSLMSNTVFSAQIEN